MLRRHLRRRRRSGSPPTPRPRKPPRQSTKVTPPRRVRVFRRDGYRCTQCGAGDRLTVHHVVPAREGGSGWPDNLVTLCSPCHLIIHNLAAP